MASICNDEYLLNGYVCSASSHVAPIWRCFLIKRRWISSQESGKRSVFQSAKYPSLPTPIFPVRSAVFSTSGAPSKRDSGQIALIIGRPLSLIYSKFRHPTRYCSAWETAGVNIVKAKNTTIILRKHLIFISLNYGKRLHYCPVRTARTALTYKLLDLMCPGVDPMFKCIAYA